VLLLPQERKYTPRLPGVPPFGKRTRAPVSKVTDAQAICPTRLAPNNAEAPKCHGQPKNIGATVVQVSNPELCETHTTSIPDSPTTEKYDMSHGPYDMKETPKTLTYPLNLTDTKVAFLGGHIDGHFGRILIDSGAFLNLISKQFLQPTSTLMAPFDVPTYAETANGSRIAIVRVDEGQGEKTRSGIM
jgi:hypothetical protein